ncbi:MAG: hypothetical protein QY318_01795 [Candidatus Dojkabacteria bacterium]|nr:MAG: hypothetical protein QY318_01795 [Candidatus Dojkabacteria bacterium]
MKRLLKYSKYFFVMLVMMLVLIGYVPSSAPVKAQGGYKTWNLWWAPLSSPWVFKPETQMGGYKFMKYDHATDYAQLQGEFNAMLAYHKPHVLQILLDTKDVYPPRWSQDNSLPSNHPGGTNKINDFVDFNNPDYDYYDDLVDLARINGIEVFFLINTSAYGGQAPYPYSYYSLMGWYWCRPDWGPGMTIAQKIAQGYCMSDPATDAMRHPSSNVNGSNYNWIEHIMIYQDSHAHPNGRHLPLTTNGVEMEHLGAPIQVYESADMVFNGLDTDLGVHTPVPSYSSDAFLNFTKKVVGEGAERYKDHVNVRGYLLWQEPSYSHIRENMVFTTGYAGDRDYEIGDQNDYQVDYSTVELAKYNAWRATRNESPVSQVPFPQNANYELFKKYNMARFMNEIANEIRAKDSNAETIATYYYDNNLHMPEVDFSILNSVVQASGLHIEPPSHYPRHYNNQVAWQTFANGAKGGNPSLNTHLSGFLGTENYHPFLSTILTDYYAAGFVMVDNLNGANSVGNYAIWSGCTPDRVECQHLQPSTNVRACIPDCVTRSCSEGDGCGGTCTQCQGGGNVTPQQVIDAYGDDGGPADTNSDGRVNGIDFVNAL